MEPAGLSQTTLSFQKKIGKVYMGFYTHLNALNVLLQADEILKAVAEKMNKHSEDVVQLYEIQESGGKLERDSRLTAGSALA